MMRVCFVKYFIFKEFYIQRGGDMNIKTGTMFETIITVIFLSILAILSLWFIGFIINALLVFFIPSMQWFSFWKQVVGGILFEAILILLIARKRK